jgi:ketosteroid isomerase-like protein
MSGENVEFVRGVYAEWRHGNFQAGVDRYDSDAVLVQHPGFPEAGTYEGLAGFAAYMHTFLDAWEKVTIEVVELTEVGDSIVAEVAQRGIGKGSGAATDFGYFQVWTFRDGKVVRLEVIRDREAAFEAAGAST